MVKHVLETGRKAGHIDEFRTSRYRVFHAPPFFNVDLEFEVKWHRKHLAKLHKHAKKPHTFHRERTAHKITEDHHRHFHEHVIEGIPFHERIMKQQEKRLKTILQFMPQRVYQRIVEISREYGGTPEYFVYDKASREFFFVASHLTEERRKWMRLVKEAYRLCDVVVIGR